MERIKNKIRKIKKDNMKNKMINKFIYSILLMAFLSMAINSNYAVQMGELQYNPSTIHPGDDVDLWLKVVNDNSDNNIKDIKVSISPHYPFEIKQVNPTKGTANIPHLNIGESDTTYFKLHANEEATSRDYRIDITVEYTEVSTDNGETTETERKFTKIYYIPVYGKANFEITVGNGNNKDNSALIPSRTSTIPLNIINKGTGTAKQCTISVGGNELISPIGTTKFYIGALKPNAQNTIYLNLHTNERTPESSYLIPATIKWIDEDGTEKTEIINIGVVVQGDILLGISNIITTPKEIKPSDDKVRIDATITNNGQGRAKDILLKLKLNDSVFEDSWSSANFKSLGSLSGGESKTVSFYIDVDKYAPAKKYTIPLTMEYLDIYNQKHNTTQNIEIFVQPKPIIAIIPEKQTLTPGKNKIKITVKNIGNTRGESIKVSAIKNAVQPFEFDEKTDYIGTLKPGETGTAIIEVKVDKDAEPKDYRLTVELRSTGDRESGDDSIYISQEAIELTVDNKDSGITTMVMAIVVIVVIVGVYYRYSNRKKKEETN
ncbi:COG1361 S-layer family protein [Methanococcus aeolicus]|uniref:CARDB domain-containing protein n=1 Tax=Methanococcus aeolicus (strain ATCC BAA-1280 / DSM 17508 / OCM 812 / Nankai-3) TaxID=419665 RepID=A6UWK0_META3|nr:COG1361 S-layer family protein [Methanococcus aeolicus]ABR56872.1 conserved hypothetical protein [Methanococcus aeolicus Nankai-3]UXM84873.1 COG1361 S-layer family protein [Methanococcus aeolicus]